MFVAPTAVAADNVVGPPAAPTATHPFAWKHEMAFRLAVVPLFAVTQVCPPFVVFRIVPAAPAA